MFHLGLDFGDMESEINDALDENILNNLFSSELISVPGDANAEVTISQLFDIKTQDLKPSVIECKENLPLTNPAVNHEWNKENLPKIAVSTPQTNTAVNHARFANPLSAVQLQEKQRNTVPVNTRRNTNWCVNLWKEWAEQRNQRSETAIEQGYPIPSELDRFQSFQEMDFWLQRFIYEIRRKDGTPYPPATLSSVAAAIQRHLRTEKSMHVNIFKSDDPTFAGFRKALDSRMRELTNEGIGIEKKSADPVTKEDEEILWTNGVLSLTEAKGLSKAVFLYNGKIFGLRGGEEHIGLLAEQFCVGYDDVNKRRYIKFSPRIRKNAQGGLKQSKKAQSVSEPIVHYDQEVPSSHSIFNLYETYLNLIPKIGGFYRKPLDGLKFGANNIPQRDLKNMMKTIFNQAGIPMDNRNISNHSGRVTLCTTLFNDRFGDKSVMNRSKHTSSAVKVYQREAFPLQSEVSSALEPAINKTVKKCETACFDASDRKPEVPITKSKNSSSEYPCPDVKDTSIVTAVEDKQEQPGDNDNTVQLFLPSTVNKLVVIKADGKKMVVEI